MVKLVLLHREDSIYEDRPDVVYDFPRPKNRRNAPYPENLRWHRENVFGRALQGDPAPWG